MKNFKEKDADESVIQQLQYDNTSQISVYENPANYTTTLQ